MSAEYVPGTRARWRASGTALAVAAILGMALAGPAQAATPTPKPTVYLQNTGGADPLPSRRFMVRTWLVADADTGQVLAAQNPHQRMPPASTVKMLTLYSMLPRLRRDSVYAATKQDVAAEGSKVGLVAGSGYTVEDLYRGMFMPSGNDAASAVANAYGGWERALRVMNAEAQRLHANDTQVRNPSGLDDPEQFSTAFDLAVIMRAALQDPEFRRIASIRQSDFPGAEPTNGRTRGTYQIWTENRLLLNGYPGTVAGKTGFTSQAGRTFVSAVERDGKTLIVVLMRSAFSTERTAEALFEWGFKNHDKVTPVGQLPEPDPRGTEPIPRPAQVLDVDGTPVPGRNPRIPEEEVAIRDVVTAGISPLAFLVVMVLLLLGAVATLRARVLLRMRRRRRMIASRSAARTGRPDSSAPQGAVIDLRPDAAPPQPDESGSATNPTRW